MQRLTKEEGVFTLIVVSLILFAFLLLVTTNTIINVSGVETEGVGVYWDSNCAKKVLLIDWGNLTPGSEKSVVVYIRNEVEERIYLIMSTTNWNPLKASDYITLGWDYTGQRMNRGETLQIVLTLSVSHHIKEISSFSLDIIIAGSQRLPGDVDGDDDVDPMDLLTLRLALSPGTLYYGTTPGADVNMDGYIDPVDLMTFKIIISSVRAQPWVLLNSSR